MSFAISTDISFKLRIFGFNFVISRKKKIQMVLKTSLYKGNRAQRSSLAFGLKYVKPVARSCVLSKHKVSRDEGKTERFHTCLLSQANQIHSATSKSGLRKRPQTVDEHSLSLLLGRGCAPPLRGGYHSRTLKSVLRADNVCILPAQHVLQPSASYTHLSIALCKC